MWQAQLMMWQCGVGRASARRALCHVRGRCRQSSSSGGAALSPAVLRALEAATGGAEVLREAADTERYRRDLLGQFELSARAGTYVVRPRSTEEVCAVLRVCNEHRVPVVPQGGGTGLVGGGIPRGAGEVVLSLERMDRVLAWDEEAAVVTLQAGVTLERADDWLRDHGGFMMPLDLGAKGTCQVGGNASTNAGGLRYLRYGSMHHNTLGLKVALADGRVLDLSNTMKKNSTGFNLAHLFIGAEGCLGVITELNIQVRPRPRRQQVSFLGLQSFEDVVRLYHAARRDLGETLSAFEFMDRESLAILDDEFPAMLEPVRAFARDAPFCALIETSECALRPTGDVEGPLMLFLEEQLLRDVAGDGTEEDEAAGSGLLDAVLVHEPSKVQEIWKIRETIPTALAAFTRARDQHVLKYDVSLPLGRMYDLVDSTRALFETPPVASASAEAANAVSWGHLGDGNLHLNVVLPNSESPLDKSEVDQHVYETVVEQRGSISAEHGIGQLKSKYMTLAKDGPTLDMMRAVKDIFDPNGILNRGKLLPLSVNAPVN